MQQAEDKGLCKGSSEQHSDINKGKQLENRQWLCLADVEMWLRLRGLHMSEKNHSSAPK